MVTAIFRVGAILQFFRLRDWGRQMSAARVLFNGVIALVCFGAGIYLLAQDSFFLHDRWHPETGTLFIGMTLYMLAAGLLLLGAFSAAVGLAWARGSLALPDQHDIPVDPSYQGKILVRFWYLLVPAFVLILVAFAMGQSSTNPKFEVTPHSQSIQHDMNPAERIS